MIEILYIKTALYSFRSRRHLSRKRSKRASGLACPAKDKPGKPVQAKGSRVQKLDQGLLMIGSSFQQLPPFFGQHGYQGSGERGRSLRRLRDGLD
jgi:hypothetical protein